MEISYLREFVELAHTCQFQETAEKLYISQPTLSKHIKIIEKELGAQLFNRSTRRVELTDTGRAFLSYASQIAMLQQDYTQELIRSDTSRRIRVASDATISLRQIEKFFAIYLTEHPNVGFELAEYDKTTLRNLLRSGDLDLIIACRNLTDTDSEFGMHPYYEDTLCAVLSPKNPLYSRESVSIQDLRSFPFVQSSSMNFAQYLDSSIPEAKYKSEPRTFVAHLLNVTDAVAVVPTNVGLFLSTNDIAEDLRMIPIEPATPIHVDIIYLKSKENTAFIRTVCERVDGEKENLAAQEGFSLDALDPLMV